MNRPAPITGTFSIILEEHTGDIKTTSNSSGQKSEKVLGRGRALPSNGFEHGIDLWIFHEHIPA